MSLASLQAAASVAADSTWHIRLGALKAGGPHQLTIEGDGRVAIEYVLNGEVWIGSGQSNMQWTVSFSDSASAEIAAA